MKALFLLYRLQAKATFRRLLRGMKTLKGALITLFFLVIISGSLFPVFISVFQDQPASLNSVETYFPFALLAYFIYSRISSIGDRAIYFTPSEIDHLFPAPFSRKQLLGYKIFSGLIASIYMAGAFACALAIHCKVILFAFVGIYLTLCFLRMSDMFAALVGQVVSVRLYSTGRKVIAIGCLVLLGLGLFQAFLGLGSLGTPSMDNVQIWFDAIRNSTFGKIVLAPFLVFSNVIFTDSFGTFMLWGSIALAMNVGLVIATLMLDANYLETAAGISQKFYDRARRFQAGQTKVSKKASGWKIKMLPFMNGFGPVAWRQLITVVRQSKTTIVMGLVVAIALGIPVAMGIGDSWVESPKVVGAAFAIMAYLTFIFSMSAASGFRADVNHIEVFKSLPLRPFMVAAGQLVGPILLFVMMHTAMTVIGVIASRDFFEFWFAGYAFIVLFDILLISLSNTLFLVFPVKQVQGGTQGIESAGQNFLIMFFQGIAFFIVAIGVSLPSLVVYWLTDSFVATFVVAWLLTAVFAMASVYLTGLAYSRFDVTKIPM